MSIQAAVQKLIDSKPQPLSPDDAVLAELAKELAALIAAPETEARFIAGLARELRSTVDDLAGGAEVDGFAELAARLSAPVVDPAH